MKRILIAIAIAMNICAFEAFGQEKHRSIVKQINGIAERHIKVSVKPFDIIVKTDLPENIEIIEVTEEHIEEEAIPFQLVEEKPSFNGGDSNMFSKWVNERLLYPEVAKANGVQGRVTLQFTVEKDGTITKVKVLRSVEPSLDREAVRVVSLSPKWKPGMQKGKAVAVSITFPVIFQLR